MNVLVSGCSFTHWPEEPGSEKNICWPAHLQKKRPEWNIVNLAEPGAGNIYIANSVVRYVLENPKKVDLVLVMWSGVSRLDFLTDLTNSSWHSLFDRYGFYRRIESCPNTLGYIFSGGNYGPWTQNKDITSLFKQMYMISSNLSLAHTNLIEMIKCQSFLQAQGVPYKFMSYVNYWHHGDNCSPNGDFGVFKYPELQPLIDQIDWKNWIFQNSQRDGIYEMAKVNNDYHGDRFHPGITTHQQWVDIMLPHLPLAD